VEAVSDLLAQLPENTDLVVLDENGNPVSLASQDAMEIVQEEDPLWCPVGEPLDSPLCQNFTGIGSVQALIDSMRTDPGTYASDGIVYFTSTVNGALILSDASTSLGASFAALSQFNLTLQGGWDGTFSTIANLNGQSNFGGNIISIGTVGNPWIGSLTLNDISTLNTASTTDASLTLNSNGTVELNNVSVAGSGAGQDGINISAPTVNLNNVTSTYHEGNGISIATTSNGGTVTLNNVIANNNGHMNGSNPVGSGVYIDGSITTVNVISGSFDNNARYGIEALNSNSTTLPVANVWTDTQDYAPGSVVTISGGDNNLNGDNVGFIAGETIHVEVTGPNGYTAACEAVADEYGKWSCQITLWSSELAVGDYLYTANGLTSGVSVSGAFTDSRVVNTVTLNGVATVTVGSGGTITIVVNVTTDNGGGNNDWQSTAWRIGNSGAFTCVNHADHTTSGTYNETFTITAPVTPDTYNISFISYSNDTCTQGASTTFTITNGVVVGKITLTLSVTNSPVTYNGAPRAATVTGSVPGTVSNILTGGAPTQINSGTYAVTANFVPNDTTNYNSLTGASAGNFVINQANPTIIFGAAPTPTYLGGNFTVSATTTNTDSAALTYSHVSGPCAFVSGSTFSSSGAGTCVVQASGAATTNFNAISATQNVTIARATPVITFAAAPTPISGSNFSVSAITTNTQSSTLTYSRVSGPCAFVSGSTFSSSGAGTCVVQASGAQTTNFNAISATQNVTISSANTPPILTLPANITAEATGSSGTAVSFTATSTDAEDNPDPTPICAPASGSTFPIGTTTVGCSVTDSGGLTASGSFTVTISDTTPPTISAAAATPPNGAGWYNTNVTIHFTCADAASGIATCPTDQILTASGTSTAQTATDNAGNTSAPSNTFMVQIDKVAPTITAAIFSGTLGNNGWYTSNVVVRFTCSDTGGSGIPAGACPADQTLSTEGSSISSTAQTVTDRAGNTSAASSVITVKIDKTVPTISAAAASPAANGNGWNNSNVTVTWSCTDGTSGPVSPTVAQTVSTEGENQSASGTCQDNAGNSASNTQNGINIDKTGPTISASPTTSPNGAGWYKVNVVVHFTCSDALSGIPGGACPANQLLSTEGTAVNSTAQTVTDAAGNTSVLSNVVTVKIDKTAPSLVLPSGITAEATSSIGATVNYSASASDNLDGSVTAICSPASGSLFLLDATTTVNCTATDDADNSTSGNFDVTVVDTTAPLIAPHADIIEEATSGFGATVIYSSPTTSDVVDGAGTATCLPASGTNFALGVATVTCDASDTHGNAASTTFTITVQDTVAPVIASHADIVEEATGASGATVFYTNPATSDAVDGPGFALCSPPSGSAFGFGDTTVTCSATDSQNNAAIQTTFKVTVEDTTPPVIDPIADITLNTTNSLGRIATYSLPATSDVVDGSGFASCTPSSGSFFPVGDTIVTCSASDSHENASSITFTVHVVHVEKPTINLVQGFSGIIPVTGGELIDLACTTIVNAFGVKVSFYNLCDHQATLISMDSETLPGSLPEGFTFVKGLDVAVLFDGKVIETLPDVTGIQMDFPVPANSNGPFAVLYWSDEDGDGNGEWLEISNPLSEGNVSQALSTDGEDELYKIIISTDTLKKILTTEFTGIFVLVQK